MPTIKRGLSPKEKEFCDHFIDTNNGTLAVRKTWGGQLKDKNQNLNVKAHRLLSTNINVKNYLNDNLHKAKSKVVELIDSKREEIALKSSIFVIEAVEGKAQQSVSVTSDSKTLNIESMTVLMARLGDLNQGQAIILEPSDQPDASNAS